MLDVVKGVPRVRSWPAKRGAPKTPEAQARVDFFRHASWAAKYLEPGMQADMIVGREGTAFLPRDIAFMMLAGTMAYVTLPNGRRIYPMQAMSKVSESLDSITQTPGMMLVRGPQFWEARVAPGGETETAWAPLTFSSAPATKWNGLSWLQADQLINAHPGLTIEFQVKFQHFGGGASAMALSADGQRCLAGYHWTDGNQFLGYHVTSGGAFNTLNGPANNFTGDLWETISLNSTCTLPVSGIPNLVVCNNGFAPLLSAAAGVSTFNLNGDVSPFWLSSPNGLADIAFARYRLVGP